MKITIQRSDLKRAVTGFNKIISGKPHLPVLQHVHLEAGENGIVARATNLDQIAAYSFTDTEVSVPGECLIPLTALKGLTKGRGSETVEIESEADDVIRITNHVQGHAVTHPVGGLALEEWPQMDLSIDTAPAEGFLERFQRAAPFTSTDETRVAINGVYVDTAGEGDRPHSVVATDGRRLTVYNGLKLPVERSFIIPTSKFLGGIKPEQHTEIGIREEDDTVWFGIRNGPWKYVAKCVDGEYPNYKQVIPDNPDAHRYRLTDSDVEVIGKVLPTLPDSKYLTLAGNDGRITLHGGSANGSDATTLTLETSEYSGDGGYIGLDKRFFTDALKAGFRDFATHDTLSPLLSRDGSDGLHVLMPIRTAEPPQTAVPEPRTEAAENVTRFKPVEPSPTPSEQQSEKRPTPKRRHMPETKNDDTSALERVQDACDTARTKVKEAGQALTALSKAIRDVSREQKQKEKDVEAARSAIKKVQSLSLAA